MDPSGSGLSATPKLRQSMIACVNIFGSARMMKQKGESTTLQSLITTITLLQLDFLSSIMMNMCDIKMWNSVPMEGKFFNKISASYRIVVCFYNIIVFFVT
jgi:hypothetical protein